MEPKAILEKLTQKFAEKIVSSNVEVQQPFAVVEIGRAHV